jgi:hypothetical protein
MEIRLEDANAAGRLRDFPPVLTFQSALDATVSTRAVFDGLYGYLPAHGGHEIVVFDRNWSAEASALLEEENRNPLLVIVPPGPRNYAVTVLSNGPGSGSTTTVEATTVAAGERDSRHLMLTQSFPPNFYSLSHVALPFPPDDALYGYLPSPDDFGLRLGVVSPRGERGSLIVNADTLMRASCNPFFDYMMGRIDAHLPTH